MLNLASLDLKISFSSKFLSKYLINANEIGKVLIENDYPFALIKFLDKNFDENLEFKTKEASINIKKPKWITK